MKYESREATFDVPARWHDRSVVAFAGQEDDDEGDLTFALTRERMAPGMVLSTLVTRSLARLSQAMNAFELVDSRDVVVDGVAAVQHVFHWRPQGGERMVRYVTFVPAGTRVLVFSGSARAAHADEAAQTFDCIMRTVKLEAVTPSPRPPPIPTPPRARLDDYGPPQGYGPGTRRRECSIR